MAIEDFEWEGEVELTQPAQARRRELATESRPRASFGWLQKSVWLEPALRLLGMAVLLGVLAGLGVVATTYAKPGLRLPEGTRALVAALGTSWLKPTPEVDSERHADAKASAAPHSPVKTPAVGAGEGSAPPPPATAPAGVTADGKVILNVASAEELTRLPGIGKKRAEAIVALRTRLKRFKQVTDLLRVKGIGPRGLRRMLPHLVLDAP